MYHLSVKSIDFLLKRYRFFIKTHQFLFKVSGERRDVIWAAGGAQRQTSHRKLVSIWANIPKLGEANLSLGFRDFQRWRYICWRPGRPNLDFYLFSTSERRDVVRAAGGAQRRNFPRWPVSMWAELPTKTEAHMSLGFFYFQRWRCTCWRPGRLNHAYR